LAARGARIVLNDVGAEMDGSGTDAGLAVEAVEALRSKGGLVEPDTSDVSTPEGAEALIDHAVRTFGGLDVVVNNAGIFWIDSFPRMDRDEMDRQLAVHVGGSFMVTRAAWPHLVRSGRGRVVLTTSSGALGSPDLTAYGTAKAAVLGLARSLAITGRAAGIKVNAIAPMAMTRMMAAGGRGAAADARSEERDPCQVAALVAVLCHDGCPTSGEAFNAGMRRYSRFVIAENDGYLHPDFAVSPEDLVANWGQVMDMSQPRIVSDVLAWGKTHFAMMRTHPTSVST
jgi:NAD(P)-dependent dehydrogenase (short-subunit alcohol dehydrogenase family)